ncbi:MAG: hypothetical protein KAJ51_04395 [Thermoplasmata archaeon]|nr:hypothetical protein [Thermoplasmata archaeon]
MSIYSVLLTVFWVLVFSNNVVANGIPIHFNLNFDVRSSFINIGRLIIVNLPINLICILSLHFVVIAIRKKYNYSSDFPLLSIFNLAIIITVFGAVIDAYLINYPMALMDFGRITEFTRIGAVSIGLVLIFFTFFGFSKLLLKYSNKESILLGVAMVVINIVFWFIFLSAELKFSDREEMIELDLALAFYFGIFMVLITIFMMLIYFLKVKERAQPLPQNIKAESKIEFRYLAIFVLAVLLVFLYFSPLLNYQSDYGIVPENAIVHDLSISEKGNYVGSRDSASWEEVINGYTQEHSETKNIIELGTARLISVKFRLNWTDEEPEDMFHTNQPDTFQIQFITPFGVTESSSPSDSGLIEFSYTVPIDGQEIWDENIMFYIVAQECGDQEALVRTIEDDGNSWTVQVNYETEQSRGYWSDRSEYWIFIWIYTSDFIWICMILTVIILVEAGKRLGLRKYNFEKIARQMN